MIRSARLIAVIVTFIAVAGGGPASAQRRQGEPEPEQPPGAPESSPEVQGLIQAFNDAEAVGDVARCESTVKAIVKAGPSSISVSDFQGMLVTPQFVDSNWKDCRPIFARSMVDAGPQAKEFVPLLFALTKSKRSDLMDVGYAAFERLGDVYGSEMAVAVPAIIERLRDARAWRNGGGYPDLFNDPYYDEQKLDEILKKIGTREALAEINRAETEKRQKAEQEQKQKLEEKRSAEILKPLWAAYDAKKCLNLQLPYFRNDEPQQSIANANFGYTIVQNLGKHRYEITGPNEYNQYSFKVFQAPSYAPRHAVLQTTVTDFESAGLFPAPFYARLTGYKKVQMKDGFSQQVGVLLEAPECRKLAVKIRKAMH